MRTEVEIWCPFGRDVSWITQEIVEAWAGACLSGDRKAATLGLNICGNDFQCFELLKSIFNDSNVQFIALKEELLDEYGIDYFRPIRSKQDHIADLEERMRDEKNNKVYAALAKELREFRQWSVKPVEAAPSTTVNVFSNQQVSIDRHNPREVERYYQSIMG